MDLVSAWRRLRASPGYCLVVVVSLALGVGANLTMFGILDGVYFRSPAGVQNADRVVKLDLTTFPDSEAIRGAPTFAQVAAYAPRSLTVDLGDEPRNVRALLTSASFFPLLRTQPETGRWYSEEEDRPGQPHLVVLAHSFWAVAFGGRADVLGKTLRVGGEPYTVIGVAPKDFVGIESENVSLFLPIESTKSFGGSQALTSRNYRWIRTIARLADGVSAPAAASQVAAILDEANSLDSATVAAQPPREVLSLQTYRHRQQAGTIRVVGWATALAMSVLLIGCANLANLLLVRLIQYLPAVAIRSALGAGYWRQVGPLVWESVLLTVFASLLGLVISLVAGHVAFVRLIFQDGFSLPLLTPPVVAAQVASVLLAVLVAGVGPILALRRIAVARILQAAGGSAVRGLRGVLRRVLLGLQLALLLALLAFAVLFEQSLRRIQAHYVGVDAEHLAFVFLDLPNAGFKREESIQVMARLAERVSALPGVSNVSISVTPPVSNGLSISQMVTGRDSLPSVLSLPGISYQPVSPSYFATTGIRLIRGELLGNPGATGTQRVTVVSRRLAEAYWPDQDPLGQCIHLQEPAAPCWQVVGIVSDRMGVAPDTTRLADYYVPIDSDGLPSEPVAAFGLRTLLIRTTKPADGLLLGSVNRTVRQELPQVPLVQAKRVTDLLETSARPLRIGAALFVIFGGLAGLLGSLGVYGVTSSMVTERTAEIGIRLALGAGHGAITRLFVTELIKIAVPACVVGALAVLLAHQSLEHLLYGAPKLAILPIVEAAFLLLVALLVGGLGPVFRALRMDPSRVIRDSR